MCNGQIEAVKLQCNLCIAHHNTNSIKSTSITSNFVCLCGQWPLESAAYIVYQECTPRPARGYSRYNTNARYIKSHSVISSRQIRKLCELCDHLCQLLCHLKRSKHCTLLTLGILAVLKLIIVSGASGQPKPEQIRDKSVEPLDTNWRWTINLYYKQIMRAGQSQSFVCGQAFSVRSQTWYVNLPVYVLVVYYG